ncbi:PREDICTED: pyruvate kinase-like isoform X2 [Papilio polytes]|uniref:pyruvate kinase-like isoform X2 n=1 Tax=Papilio polytes TaxID=76194 RepID=UPI00067679DD|nr:PREDICTED: pyruvate kinase-like isoform X2 [Papilio polytes]
MALPWHIPLESLPKLKKGGVKESLLKHYCSINVHENPCEELKTGLMCDIGYSNKESSTIQKLIAAGMTVAHLNIRELEPEACGQIIQSIRQAVYNYSTELQYVHPLALIIDVRGPDIVSGDLKGGPHTTVEIIQNETIRLTTDATWRECGTADCLYIGYDHLTDLQVNDIVFIDSLTANKIKLIVSEVGDDSIECSVVTGGTIGPKMAVQISQVPREIPNLNKKESLESISHSDISQQNFEQLEEQIKWAVSSDIDAVLLPNTQSGNDIRHIRNILSNKGNHILVFASIDTVQGLDNIDDILTEADGIYLDRSILSTDLPVEKIFIAQKIIMAKCNNLDGADVIALELHYDSPLRKFAPAYDAVRMAEHCLAAAAVICRHAERIIWKPHIYGNFELMQSPLEEPTKAICVGAVELALRSQAVIIICLTNSGRTARILSHVKPPCPIIAVTRTCHTSRQLRFFKGIRTIHYFEEAKAAWDSEVENRVRAALDYCKIKRLVEAGDAYVVVAGSRRNVGYCDSVRLLYASVRNRISVP